MDPARLSQRTSAAGWWRATIAGPAGREKEDGTGMTQAANPTSHLVRDSKTRIWNARWWVPRPEHERKPGEKPKHKEKRKSLGTRDLAEARRLLGSVLSKARAVRDGHLPDDGGAAAVKRSPTTWAEVRKAFEEDLRPLPAEQGCAGALRPRPAALRSVLGGGGHPSGGDR